MSWTYAPDGKLAGRGDDGVPAGEHVVLVDDSDVQNVRDAEAWATRNEGDGFHGISYRRRITLCGLEACEYQPFSWRLQIPADGNYEVFVRYVTVSSRQSGQYTIVHDDGENTHTVDQTRNSRQWVSLGSYCFSKGGDHTINLDGSANTVADAVMLVRDNSGETDAEAKDITYAYDANGNLTGITDDSSGAQVDAYEIDYTGLNQVQQVRELAGGSVANTTSFSYDANGNPLTTTHDDTYAEYAYDVRDLVAQVTNAESASDSDPKITGYAYTPNGWTATEAKPNGNTVAYEYYLDGLLKHQLETKANGTTVVSEHSIGYDANGNRVTDVARTMDAYQHNKSSDRTYTYSYDPGDRIAQVRKTDTRSGAVLSTETYRHDPASNVVEQTIGGVSTSFVYDRNRLLTATTGGVSAAYNYDPFGRLNTVTAAGQVIESYAYDGFDRITQHESIDGTGASESTSYTYDPLDRTTSRTDHAGETTDYSYLGLSGEVLSEEIAGEVQKSYQYSPWGKRLSQVTHDADGSEEDAFYGYNPHTDVEVLTDQAGDPVSTYGYTAYGNNDEAEFTGVDAPDAGTPGDEPYNVYRYNAKRWDSATGTYDMGFRDYNPGINRFLSRDMYTGALNDLNLGLSPWTNNRYAFTGGNPITLIELDGHNVTEFDSVGGFNTSDDVTSTDIGKSYVSVRARDTEDRVYAEREPDRRDQEVLDQMWLVSMGLLFKDWENAERHLLHWLRNTGEPLEVDPSAMLDALPTFQTDVDDYVRRKEEGEILSFSSGWISTRALETESLDWYYALNGFEYRISGPPNSAHQTLDVRKRYDWGTPSENRNDIYHKVLWVEVDLRQWEIAHLHTVGLAQDYDIYGSTRLWE
jgi:RHS repeat-associated protein